MHIIVGGCGRLGAEIAERLSTDPDHDVVVVDIDPLAFDRLGTAFNGETVRGDATDRDVLQQAGVAHADGFLAVTRFDNANLMAVEIATHLYDVPRTVARLFNPERESVYRKLGVRYVSGTGLLAKLFLNELGADHYQLHVAFEHGEVAVVEVEIDQRGHGLKVADVEEDGLLRIAGVTRGTRVFIPSVDDTVEAGDLLAVAVRGEGRRRLMEIAVPPYVTPRLSGPEPTDAGVPTDAGTPAGRARRG